ncbi:MAG: hypothetical protein KF912_08000 [Phycisphaeraceae bacterium]|nr:hypothetical protein [Phycisphaeraceae bacterium]
MPARSESRSSIPPEGVSIAQVPFEEAMQARMQPDPQILGTSYFTAKGVVVHPADSRSSLRAQAAKIGASRVVWATRVIESGQTLNLPEQRTYTPSPEQPTAYRVEGRTITQGNYSQTSATITPNYSGASSPSSSFMQGMAIGQSNAATAAAIVASMPTYEFIAIYRE